MERTVKVWGKDYTVRVEQKLKTVWYAVGEYRGETLGEKGQTRGAALKAWAERAKYRGNG